MQAKAKHQEKGAHGFIWQIVTVSHCLTLTLLDCKLKSTCPERAVAEQCVRLTENFLPRAGAFACRISHGGRFFVPMITDKARKVVCLGLNESASQGEWQAAAIAVFQLWRKDGLSDEDLFPPDAPRPEPVGVEIMPFGKFRGWSIHAVPLDYLRWMLANLDNLSPELRNRVTFEVQNRR